jgi:hypothetical protein
MRPGVVLVSSRTHRCGWHRAGMTRDAYCTTRRYRDRRSNAGFTFPFGGTVQPPACRVNSAGAQVPALKPADAVTMDNPRVHKPAGVRRVIEAAAPDPVSRQKTIATWVRHCHVAP